MDLTMLEKKSSMMDSLEDHWNAMCLSDVSITKNCIIWSQARSMLDHEGQYKSSPDNLQRDEPEKVVSDLE
jgi:hypothetical protein